MHIDFQFDVSQYGKLSFNRIKLIKYKQRMKHYISIIILIFSTSVFGQKKDIRAELDIKGRINEISVSPNEQVWLTTATGNMYYSNSINSNWYYGKPIFEADTGNVFNFDGPHLDRISFFNKDTALISGYINLSKESYDKGGYYLTKDGGITWQLKDFGGNTWIYAIDINNKGGAWMGGLSQKLHVSNDFGESWRVVSLPYKSSDRTYGIHMIDYKNGIVSSDDNEILLTNDNWINVVYLETPYDQKKYVDDTLSGYPDKRISKIYIWNNHVVVNQSGNIFYTDFTEINWKKFPVEIVEFELDRHSKELFAITKDLKVILFSSPDKYVYLSQKSMNTFPLDLKVSNNSLYIIDQSDEIYKVNKREFIRAIPYTTDKKIAEPTIIKNGNKLTWGISGKQVYLSEEGGENWYREDVLDFSVSDFKLTDDSTAILWDGYKNNFYYSLKDHSVKVHERKEPLKSFLEFPLKSVSINSGTQGCFHSDEHQIDYKVKNKDILVTTRVDNNDFNSFKLKRKNEVSTESLVKILKKINDSPSLVPTIQDFNITEKDKENYLNLVNKRCSSNRDELISGVTDKVYYENVLKKIDTLNTQFIGEVLDKQEGYMSTTSNWFSIQITNKNNDTIHINRSYYIESHAWNLPWEFEFNGQHFNCYNIDFSRFINDCIPNDFIDKDIFDNKYFMMNIADYLYNKE